MSYQVLPVPNVDMDVDMNREPENGDEFLALMRAQGAQYPDIMGMDTTTTGADTTTTGADLSDSLDGGDSLDGSEGGDNLSVAQQLAQQFAQLRCVTTPPECLPDSQWEAHVVSAFEDTRAAVRGHREALLESGAPLPGLPEGAPNHVSNWYGWRQWMQSHRPVVSVMDALSLADVAALVRVMGTWWQETPWAENKDAHELVALRLVQTEWTYALLAVVDPLFNSDMCAAVRAIVRTATQHRCHGNMDEGELLPHLNVVITVIARVFDQGDLLDYPAPSP